MTQMYLDPQTDHQLLAPRIELSRLQVIVADNDPCFEGGLVVPTDATLAVRSVLVRH